MDNDCSIEQTLRELDILEAKKVINEEKVIENDELIISDPLSDENERLSAEILDYFSENLLQ